MKEKIDEVLKKEDFAVHLASFQEEFQLSFSDLGKICGKKRAISQTSCFRLCKGTTTNEYYLRVLPELEEGIEAYLLDQQLRSDVAEEFLLKLFPYRKERENMIINRTILTSTAVKFFGLSEDPFDVDRVPGENEMFSTPELDEITRRICDAVLYNRFICVSGAIGSGKTSMKIRVHRELRKAKLKSHLIYPEFFDMAQVNVGAIASAILDEFEVKSPHSSTARVKRIKNQLMSLNESDTKIALIFDESHRLNEKVVLSLKNFWEMTDGAYSRLLGIVLYCQPKFVEVTLRDYRFKEIAERIDVVEMPSIAKSAADYLAHKISTAGGDINELFEQKAIQRICSVAKTPLALGNLANAALMKAFANEEKQVDSGMLNLPDAPRVRGLRQAA